MCVRCCQPFVAEVASGVSDVDPNGHVVRLSFVGLLDAVHHLLLKQRPLDLWFGFSLSFVVSEIDHLCVEIHQISEVSEMDPLSVHG